MNGGPFSALPLARAGPRRACSVAGQPRRRRATGNRAAKRPYAPYSQLPRPAHRRRRAAPPKCRPWTSTSRAPAGPSGPQFDPDLLRLYYARLFPYDQWCRWMAYNSDEPGTGSQLARRELSLTLADDVYIRYQCFTNAKEMKSLMTKRQPHKIDIGAVFNCVPRDHLSVKNFRPESRELVFDIDLSDYDDVRTCCQGADGLQEVLAVHDLRRESV